MKLATYNIKNGGFTNYDYKEESPPRLPQIREAIAELNADLVCLIDTFRWEDTYTADDIKGMFGYRYAYQCDLADETVESDIGLALLSNLPITDIAAVDLGSRNALRCTVESGNGKIDVYNTCLLYTSPSPRDATLSRMPSSA